MVASTVVLVLALAFFGFIGYWVIDGMGKNAMENARYAALSRKDSLRSEIQRWDYYSETWRDRIVESGGQVPNFEAYNALMMEDASAFSGIWLAPQGTVCYAYPMSESRFLGTDVFAMLGSSEAVETARRTGATALAGPMDLGSGRLGFALCVPVYLKDDQGNRSFWGFSIAVIDQDDFFHKTSLDSLSAQGYRWKLWAYDSDGSEKVLAQTGQDDKIMNGDHVTIDIDVPTGTWHLAVARSGGWISRQVEAGIVVLVPVLSLLMAGLTDALVRSHGDIQRFTRMSYADPLTGLDNFRSYTDCIDRLHRDRLPYVLFSLDMNGFKQVNDTFGHEAGDVVLRAVGSRIRETLREEDRAFRVGGDEFAVVMTGTMAEGECARICDRIDRAVAGDVAVGPGQTVAVSASVGFACYQGDDCPASEVRNRADLQMYSRKRSSRR